MVLKAVRDCSVRKEKAQSRGFWLDEPLDSYIPCGKAGNLPARTLQLEVIIRNDNDDEGILLLKAPPEAMVSLRDPYAEPDVIGSV